MSARTIPRPGYTSIHNDPDRGDPAVRFWCNMKLIVNCLILCLVVVPGSAWAETRNVGNADPRVVELSGPWSFAYTTCYPDEVPDAAAFKISMPVPGCWDDEVSRERAMTLWPDARFNPKHREFRFPVSLNLDDLGDGSMPFLLGSGWYRKQIAVPAEWRDRSVTLRVGRVVMEAWLYVNGKPVHHHLGHSTPWEVPLAPHLRFGEDNEIILAVANMRTDRNGTNLEGWQGRSGGIFGSVSLKIAPATPIVNLFVFQDDNDKLKWQVELADPPGPDVEIRWCIRQSQSRQTLAEGRLPANGRQVRWTTGTFGVKPWSDREPNLYEVEASLWSGNTRLDEVRQPFGMRRFSRDGIGLRLNDAPIYLRGVADHAYYPETCTPPLDIDWYRKHLRRLKELGFNWVRFHTHVPLEPCLQAADELGMLIQVEPPSGYQISEWRDILRFCRKHPSVVMYCCGNEEVLDEDKIEYLAQCAAEMHKLAPGTLFMPQEALRGIEYAWDAKNFGPDFVEEPYPHDTVRLEKVRDFSDVIGQFTWGALSYVSLGLDLMNPKEMEYYLSGGFSSVTPQAIDDRLIPYDRPCLTHELGIMGCYLDLNLEKRYRNTRIGPTLFSQARQALERERLIDRADVYYRNSAAWQRLLHKDAVEMARHCRRITGYDLLGANDVHWPWYGYACGVMNEFDELKAGETVADVLRYNNESVLLISDQRERNVLAGQPFARDLSVSWFGAGRLEEATVKWSLQTPDGEMLGAGQQPVPSVEAGNVAKIAAIHMTMPPCERPTKVTLSIQLSHSGGQLENQWNFWLFPAVLAVSDSKVRVVGALDAACIQELVRDGRVVLLGNEPFPSRFASFQIGLAGRPFGNLATVIADHPLLKHFPHDGYCDWQFYPMLGAASAVSFEGMDAAFDPIVEVVSSYKHIHKQGAVFEWQVGSGRLLVCTLNLRDSDPAAAYFRQCLLDYAAGDQFQPRMKVEPQQFAQILGLDPESWKPRTRTSGS